MSGLTPEGFEIKRFRDVIDSVQQNLRDLDSNIVITDSSNKVSNNIGNVFSLAISELHELGEELWNSFDIDSASGIALDRLAQFKDTQRLGEEYSKGLVEFSVNGITQVNTNVLVQDTSGRNLTCLENTTLTTSNVNSFKISYSGMATAGITYFVTLGSESFSYTAVLGNTLEEVYNTLQSQINITDRYVATNSDGVFYVRGIANVNFTLSKRGDMIVDEFSVLVEFRADVLGDVVVNANTATLLLSSVANVISVNNPRNFDRGSLKENDFDLRVRLKGLSNVTGKATPDAIIKAVTEVDGVDSINLSINNSIFPDKEGQSPKSYEVIVTGGNDQDIADAILLTGGAGIETSGNVSLLSTGRFGGSYPISFTRPTNVYVFLNIDYEKYEEFSSFPVNGEEMMRQALVDYSATLSANQDLIPSALNEVIYESVGGVGEVRITASYSYNSNDLTPISNYAQNKVPIDKRQLAVLTEERILINETIIN